MSRVQPEALPHSRPARLTQRNGGEMVDTSRNSPIAAQAEPELESSDFGAAVGMCFMWAASITVALGGLRWLINNFFPNFWSIL